MKLKLIFFGAVLTILTLFGAISIGCNDGQASIARYGKNLISVDSTILGTGTLNDPYTLNPDSVGVFAADYETANGTNEYVATLTGANGSFTSATVAKNELSGAISWVYTGEGVITGTLTNEFTANKTTVFLTLRSATEGIVLKYSLTNDDAIVINSFLVTDGTTAADFIGTISILVRVEP